MNETFSTCLKLFNLNQIVPIDKSIITLINRYITMYDVKSDEYLFSIAGVRN
jgi:hypothetical protein